MSKRRRTPRLAVIVAAKAQGAGEAGHLGSRLLIVIAEAGAQGAQL